MSTSALPAQRATGSRREQATAWIAGLHNETTDLFASLERRGSFREDRWIRPGGGGGVTRVLTGGETFEKAGINRSAVSGRLPAATAAKLGGRVVATGDVPFFATGISLVVHPRSPRIPTVHLNVRYFELMDDEGEVQDAWFGGGSDLTPTYPSPDDVREYHRAMRSACDRFHHTLHPRFKAWCDEYFRNVHRGGEPRGVGGVFFDHLRPDEDASALTASELFEFGQSMCQSLRTAYAPIVERRRDAQYGEAERQLQLRRRGRYVEFNLLHDRGTTFGLQTGARVESVLMSLPPEAAWTYRPDDSSDDGGDSLEAALTAMLVPRDWASEDD